MAVKDLPRVQIHAEHKMSWIPLPCKEFRPYTKTFEVINGIFVLYKIIKLVLFQSNFRKKLLFIRQTISKPRRLEWEQKKTEYVQYLEHIWEAILWSCIASLLAVISGTNCF